MKRKTDEERAFDKALAQIILARRAQLNLSQLYISIKSGISRITIGKWERGLKTPVAFDLYNVLKVLYDDPSDFWRDLFKTYEKDALPIREAADKKKYLDYIKQTSKKRKTTPTNSRQR